eukprot:scpid69761/ scgid12530/ 
MAHYHLSERLQAVCVDPRACALFSVVTRSPGRCHSASKPTGADDGRSVVLVDLKHDQHMRAKGQRVCPQISEQRNFGLRSIAKDCQVASRKKKKNTQVRIVL